MNGGDVVATARQWIGVPYRHQGRDKTGVDCAGLIIAIARELGLADHVGYVDKRDYPREPSTDNMMQLLRHYLTHVRTIEPREGDVLHFSFAVLPQHVAIYTGPTENRIIHAYNSGNRCVIQTGYTGKWPSRLHGVYRFKGLD